MEAARAAVGKDYMEVASRLRRYVLKLRIARISRMAYIAGLGRKKGVFSPGKMARDTGIKYSMVYRDIRLLQRLGILRKVRWGRYRVEAGVDTDLQDEIAGRLAVEKRKGGTMKRKTLAKDVYTEEILALATRNGGAVRLDEAAKEIGTGKSYAWKLLQGLVTEGKLERGARGLYLLREK
jgi:DNA-binding IscR family transcriptional regulator